MPLDRTSTAPGGLNKTVLHVITRYAAGGSERRLCDAVQATPEWTHHVLVGAEHDQQRLARDLPTTRVDVVPSLVRRLHPAADLAALRAIDRYVARPQVALVHTHQSKAGVLGRLAARRRARPAIHSLSMANFGPGFSPTASFVYRHLERILGRATTRYAVVGTGLRDRFVALGIDEEKFRVIRSSIELERFENPPSRESARRALGLPEHSRVVAFVGRYETLKGAQDLPRLVAAVRPVLQEPLVLVMAGAGELRSAVVAACRVALGEQNVVDLGYTDRVPEVIAASDAVVLLSRAEGVPQVLVQAIAARRPFVAFAADGVDELVARVTAGSSRSVPIGDLSAAVTGVASLVAATDDASEPVADLREWEASYVRAQYVELYREVLTK